MDGKDGKKKKQTEVEKDPRVTISDSLIIDVDGIIDNDDEVSLETPVTIPENPEPSEFGRAISNALETPKKSESERSSVRFLSGKDGINNDSAKVNNKQKKKPVIKSRLKSPPKLDKLVKDVNGSQSENLSDSTSNKTSGESRTSSKASQKVLKDAKVPKRRAGRVNGHVEKKIGKSKLPNGLNDVTGALASEKEQEKRNEVLAGDRPPILAPWEEKTKKGEKPNSAKNKPKKIDIDELQKDMGKSKH